MRDEEGGGMRGEGEGRRDKGRRVKGGGVKGGGRGEEEVGMKISNTLRNA